MRISREEVYSSSINDLDGVRTTIDRGKSVHFYDTTLHDGEQTVGEAFNAEEKLQIASSISDLGITRIEATKHDKVHGMHVIFFPIDTTSTDPKYFREVYSLAIENGADEVAAVDTMGVSTPQAIESSEESMLLGRS